MRLILARDGWRSFRPQAAIARRPSAITPVRHLHAPSLVTRPVHLPGTYRSDMWRAAPRCTGVSPLAVAGGALGGRTHLYRRTGFSRPFTTTTPQGGAEASPAAPSAPTKTELKRKKPAADAGAASGSATGAKRTDSAAVSKPSTADKAAALARKIAFDYPKLAVSKTIAFFRMMIFEPKEFAARARSGWLHVKEELYHYWLGSKLLWQEMRTSTALVKRVVAGYTLTRRERQQLLKTSADMFRLVPFAVFVIVPFMELLLPLALKLFPNMLPSTFETTSKKEENLQKQLQLRMDMAVFLQETVQEMAKGLKSDASKEKGAKEFLRLIEDVRSGKPLPNDAIVACAKLFKDEITLDNISRAQLVGMSKYMGLNPYGTEAMLRFALRAKIRDIKADDQMILWEGLDSLTMDELRKACADRGMRATGLTEAGYRRQLKEWLDLSINKAVPTSLLILSRAFMITSMVEPERAIQESISSLEEEVLTEAVLESAGTASKEDVSVLREMRLESLEYQNEMIEAERESAAVAVPPALSFTAPAGLLEAVAGPAPQPTPVADLTLPPVAAASTAATGASPVAAAPVIPGSPDAAVKAFALQAEALEAQKELLSKVKATRLKMEGQAMLSKGRIKAPSAAGEQPEEDTSMQRVKRKLDQMLKGLEDDLDAADKSLEGKLQTSSELHDAVTHILGNSDTDAAAEAILKSLHQPSAAGATQVTADDLKRFAELMHAAAVSPSTTTTTTATATAPALTPTDDATTAAVAAATSTPVAAEQATRQEPKDTTAAQP